MPFGLKNAGATYQRLVNAMFEEEIGEVMEVYVDDMLVKSKAADDHIANLDKVFTKLLADGMRLNPQKCILAVSGGKFLGFMVSERGIKANPKKVQAILDMTVLKTWNEVQCLMGRLVALARFISRFTDKCNPFFQLLKLTISAALTRHDHDNELPVYYCGRGFTDPEIRYPDIEKLALALITTARKLKQYFQAHTIHVLTNHPLRQILQKPETSGRMVKWAIELGEFDLHFKPRTTIKGQAAADFIAEFIPMNPDDPNQDVLPRNEIWELHVDGSSNNKLSGAWIIITDPEGHSYEYTPRFEFKASNNIAEYEALIAGIQLCRELGALHIHIFSDSQLVVNQVAGDFKANQNNLGSYKSLAGALLQHFTSYKLTQIPRAKNSKADALARLTTAPPESTPPDVHIEIWDKPSISKAYSEIFAIETPSQLSWMDPYVAFLSNGTLPLDKHEAQRLRHKASLYLLRGGKLYHRGQSCPFLRCLPTAEGHKVLKSLHSGVCGNHAGAQNLMFKALRAGYYWPTLEQDAKAVVQACLHCHKFVNFAHHPPVPLSVIISPVPYSQWGLDFVGWLPTTLGQLKFAIVLATKWIEAESLATITTEKVINFLWRNLYCRFGVPQAIITDNGAQFDNDTFREFLSKQGTAIFYASPAHPQTNGQVEAINKLIKQNLKKRLEEAKGLWAAKLPKVLWTLRTTPTTATGESSYLLSYGTEAVIPVEMEVPSERIIAYDPAANTAGLRLNMDLLEERWDRAHLRNVNYKQKVARHYIMKVVSLPLKVGDWVMKEVIPHPTELKAKWEGPMEIVNAPGPATFYLRDTDGRVLPRPWNARHLHLYHI
ncbi:PREDICTED: uncharacterized protein LOC101307997 [Fragaria vesca subsp. vesca]|uniref:uncharacterized protein LOC101307997 n=1 Tax=Fragaria vesca subsp. vesca TaxID=101020 RepID=UPI0002C3214F|nr:PREDICTED: uncharacterized protein LOC101307997 [Fragaria vesca subsp. vesca]